MANYIHTLQAENAQLRQDKAAALAALVELQAYLQSEKFAQDPTVQTTDVDNRLAPIKRALFA